MEIFTISKDIKVFYVQATSFPSGILEAHQKLQAMVSSPDQRNYFGISYPGKNGEIIYKAATDESFPGEAENSGCSTFIIPQGEYISETLIDWCKEEMLVAKTFKKLLSDKRIDQNGFCLEMYLNKTDMRCMVKIVSSEKQYSI